MQQDVVLVFGNTFSRPKLMVHLRYSGACTEYRRMLEANAHALSRKYVRELVSETATGEIPSPSKMFLALCSKTSIQCPPGFWPKPPGSLKQQKAKRTITLMLPSDDGQGLHTEQQGSSEWELELPLLFTCKVQLKAFT